MKTVKLRCEIIDRYQSCTGNININYRVYDENNETISEGTSSSEEFVKIDSGGYHTKEKFDKLFPKGWEIEFDF